MKLNLTPGRRLLKLDRSVVALAASIVLALPCVVGAQTRPTLAGLQAAVDCLNTPTQMVSIPAVARGAYFPDGSRVPGDRFLVGRVASGGGVAGPFRNYFVFDLSGLEVMRDLVVGASLVTFNPIDGYQSDSVDTLNYVLSRISYATGLPSGAGSLAAYLDVADGQVYGTYTASTAINNRQVSIELNNQALRDINHTLLPADFFHLFMVGGAIHPMPAGADNAYFLHNNLLPLTNTALVLNIRRFDLPGSACPRPSGTQYQR